MADITVQNLTKYYADKLILQDLTFDVQPGEKIAVLGANGCGKTTLLNILAGRLDYDNGIVSIGDGKRVGVIDQMPKFDPNATVDDVLRTAFHVIDAVVAEMSEVERQMTRHPDNESLLRRYGYLQQRLDALGGYSQDYQIDKVANGLEIPRAQRRVILSDVCGVVN